MVTTGRSQTRLPLICLAVLLLPLVARASLFRHTEAGSAKVQQEYAGVQQEYAGVELDEEFDVLTTIQTEVNMMNDNLQSLSEALDGLTTPSPPTTTPPTTSQPTETTSLASTMEESTTTMATTETDTAAPTTTPTTTSPTTTTAPTTAATTTTAPTTTPSTTSTTQATSAETSASTSASTSQPTSASEATSPSAPTTTPASPPTPTVQSKMSIEEQTPSPRQVRETRSEDRKTLRLYVSKRNDETCGPLSDIAATLDDATSALNRVTASQLDNTTIELLQESNTALNFTTSCIERGDITPGDTATVQASLSAAVKSGAEAADIIDAIVSPPTQAPEEDGFRAATIALGVLFSLAVVALIGMGIFTSRQNSGGHIS